MIAAIAEVQLGVAGRWQLLAAGLSPSMIVTRVRRGLLIPIHPGVYAVGHTALSRRGEWLAAVLAGGERAMLSHRSAATLLDVGDDQPGLLVEITVPHADGGRRRLDGILIHRSRLPMDEDLIVRDEIPLTSVERTLVDLACTSPPSYTRHAFERADRLGIVDVKALRALRQRATGRRGIRRLDPLLAAYREMPFTRSELERRFLHLCDANGIPRPAVNVKLHGYEVDCVWLSERLAVELDGYGYHRDRATFESDRKRDTRLQLAGFRVIRITWRRVVERPAEVAAEIRALLRLAGGSGSNRYAQVAPI